jgi:uncharacterized protein YkwD
MVRLMLVAAVALGAVALAGGKAQVKKAALAPKPGELLQAGSGGALREVVLLVKLPPDLREVLRLINNERVKEKLPELTLDPTLCKVAEDYSGLMAKKEEAKHRLDGQSAGKRVEAAGYDWKTVAENLASAVGKKNLPPPTPADLVEGWMKSKGHRDNILNGKHRHSGLGVAQSKGGNYYYTQLFASPNGK